MSTMAATIVQDTQVLNATDRCDRCGATAYVRVMLLKGGDLQFCSHHFMSVETAITPLAIAIQDERARLNS